MPFEIFHLYCTKVSCEISKDNYQWKMSFEDIYWYVNLKAVLFVEITSEFLVKVVFEKKRCVLVATDVCLFLSDKQQCYTEELLS